MARLVEAFEDDMAESPDKLIPNLGDLDLKKSFINGAVVFLYGYGSYLWFFFPNQGGPNYTMMLIAW